MNSRIEIKQHVVRVTYRHTFPDFIRRPWSSCISGVWKPVATGWSECNVLLVNGFMASADGQAEGLQNVIVHSGCYRETVREFPGSGRTSWYRLLATNALGGEESDQKWTVLNIQQIKAVESVTVFGLNLCICFGRDALSRELHCGSQMSHTFVMCSKSSDPSSTEIISIFLRFGM